MIPFETSLASSSKNESLLIDGSKTKTPRNKLHPPSIKLHPRIYLVKQELTFWIAIFPGSDRVLEMFSRDGRLFRR